ncbi:MAG: GNAT family N-acetyltransferase [Acetobacteraceae bacterium]|nr:GNAT family N-acetyltransferase [Acetobacteraceae bacterium]
MGREFGGSGAPEGAVPGGPGAAAPDGTAPNGVPAEGAALEGVVLRKAGPGDLQGILDLAACFPKDYLPRVLEEWVRQSPGGGLLAEGAVPAGGRRVLGFTSTSFPRPGEAWFQGIRIRPDCQGRGLGLALARYQLEDAAAQGARVARLAVMVHNLRARRLVEERLGFTRWGRWVVVDWEPGRLRQAHRGPRPSSLEEAEARLWLESRLARGRKRAVRRGPGLKRTPLLIPAPGQLWTLCELGGRDLTRLLGPQSLWWRRSGRPAKGSPPLAAAALERLERPDGPWAGVCWAALPPGPQGVAPAFGLIRAVAEAARGWGARYASASLPGRRAGPLVAALSTLGWRPKDEEKEWYHETYIYEFFF